MNNPLSIELFLTKELELSKNEAIAYLSLLENGASTVMELSNSTNINRSVVHVTIESLTKKGFANSIKKGKGSRRLIMAEPMEKIGLILDNKLAKIESAKKMLPIIERQADSLKKPKISDSSKMEIRRFKGKHEVQMIYEDVLRATNVRTYANVAEIAETFPENMYLFIQSAKKNPKKKIWEIMEDSAATRMYKASIASYRNIQCKLATKQINLASIDYIMYDGKIAVIEATEGINGLVIEDNNLYKNAVAIHKVVWESLT